MTHRITGKEKDKPKPKKQPGQFRKKTPFEMLAKERGVDLQAEQERAKQQLQSGQRVGGTTQQTQALQAQQAATPSLSEAREFTRVDGQVLPQPSTTPGAGQDKGTSFFDSIKGAAALLEQMAVMSQAGRNPDVFDRLVTAITPEVQTSFGTLRFLPLPLTAGAQGGFGLFSAEAPGLAKTGVANNPVTQGLIRGAAAKIAGSSVWIKVAAIGIALNIAMKIVQETYGGRVFGEFVAVEEALPSVSIVARDALQLAKQTGNFTLYDELHAARGEVLEKNSFWDTIQSWIPIRNRAKGLEKFRDVNTIAHEAQGQLRKDLEDQFLNGESDEDMWKRITQRQIETADIIANNTAATILQNTETINTLKAAAAAAEREEDKKFYEESAAFWAAERDRERKKAAADRERAAAFWLAYNKERQKITEASKPSNLNFGLL